MSNIHGVALQRAVEKNQISEWHTDQDGNLYVTVPGNGVLNIPADHVHSFVLGIMVGEGW